MTHFRFLVVLWAATVSRWTFGGSRTGMSPENGVSAEQVIAPCDDRASFSDNLTYVPHKKRKENSVWESQIVDLQLRNNECSEVHSSKASRVIRSNYENQSFIKQQNFLLHFRREMNFFLSVVSSFTIIEASAESDHIVRSKLVTSGCVLMTLQLWLSSVSPPPRRPAASGPLWICSCLVVTGRVLWNSCPSAEVSVTKPVGPGSSPSAAVLERGRTQNPPGLVWAGPRLTDSSLWACSEPYGEGLSVCAGRGLKH